MTSTWCNDTTLKFIGLYEGESVIWNPNHAQYKDKLAVSEAWARIADIMGAQVHELKRKKESMMTSYRLFKKRQAIQGNDNVTSWYAFKSLDNFLGHLYEKDRDGETRVNVNNYITKLEIQDMEDKFNLEGWSDDSTFPNLDITTSVSNEPTDQCSTNNICNQWSNQTTMKFLKHYKDESVIWDTNNRYHKSKVCLNEAWKRIAIYMNGDINDLKRKKESLMSRYRVLKKNKESMGDNYVVSWFAFEYMDDFLGFLYPVGKLCPIVKPEENINNTKHTVYIEEHLELSSPEPGSPQSEYSQLNQTSNDQVLKRPSTNGLDEDECELFGRLLAKKLRRYSLEQQLELMHKIDGLLLPNRDVLS